jgi:hypothetical protein
MCGLLLLVIFSLGLVFCFLPATNNKDEQITVVKAISNSPGNFLSSNISSYSYFLRVVPGTDFHIKNNIRIKKLGGLLNKLTGMVLYPLGLNNVK